MSRTSPSDSRLEMIIMARTLLSRHMGARSTVTRKVRPCSETAGRSGARSGGRGVGSGMALALGTTRVRLRASS
ncbi:hypothetical protein D3C78_1896620 [compost metagenome]